MQTPLHTPDRGEVASSTSPPFDVVAQRLQQVQDLIRLSLAAGAAAPGIELLLHDLSIRCGKMLRPAFVLLAGACCGTITPTHIRVAAVVEMVHNATLLHDDVIDQGQQRRGLPTVNRLHGNEAAVLLGDYVLSRVFHISADLPPDISRLIAATALRVCQGELCQVVNRCNWHLTEQEYLDIITEKSASFFSGCCRLGAVLADADPVRTEALSQFGLNAGIAFQITDDVLDIVADQTALGKTPNSDAAQNKPTLPVIHLLSGLDGPERKRVSGLLDGPNGSRLALRPMLQSSDSLQYARSRARDYRTLAVRQLDPLPPSDAKAALIRTAESMIDRSS